MVSRATKTEKDVLRNRCVNMNNYMVICKTDLFSMALNTNLDLSHLLICIYIEKCIILHISTFYVFKIDRSV